MIISGGFDVHASDLEQVLRSHPGLTDAALVGVPNPRWRQTPVAFVVAPGVDPETLRPGANGTLGKGQRIAAVETVDTPPRSAIGKVPERELRETLHPAQPEPHRLVSFVKRNIISLDGISTTR